VKALVYPSNTDVAEKLKNNDDVWGFFVGDEPFPESAFGKVADSVRMIESVAPTKVAYVNVLSTTGPFLRSFLDVVKPRHLSFDYYRSWWGGARFWEKLEDIRNAAREQRIPWTSFIEVSANPRHEHGDVQIVEGNQARLRLSVFSALAYGAKGIHWFDAEHLYDSKRGVATKLSKDVTAINTDVQAMKKALACLRSVDVFHTDPVPAGTRSFPREHWVQADGEAGTAGIALATFVDQDGRDYVFVVNRDVHRAQHVAVRFQSRWLGMAPWHQPPRYSFSYEKFDRKSGDFVKHNSTANASFLDVINAGDAMLYRVKTNLD
jgi:hypothetical protein